MAVPTLISATLDSTGLLLSVLYSEPVIIAFGSAVSVSVRARATVINAPATSGSTTATIVYTLDTPVYEGESALADGAAAIVASVSTSQNNAAFTEVNIVESAVTVVPPATGPAIRMMRNTCSISRPTVGQSTSSAGQTTTWTQFYNNVRCSVQGIGTEEPEVFMRENAGNSFKIFFPPLADIKASDRLDDFTGNAALRNQILEVDGTPIDHAGRGAYLYVVARSINLDA